MLKLMHPYFIENYIPLFISRQYKSVENLEECDIIVKIIGYIALAMKVLRKYYKQLFMDDSLLRKRSI